MGAAQRRLFYEEPEREEVEASVLSVRLTPGLFLASVDPCLFYPEGGGQPADGGLISGEPVIDVREEDGVIFCSLAHDPGLVVGARVRCVLDAKRRRDHARQHSAQHLVSHAALRLYGARTLSFHLGKAESFIDLDLPGIGRPETYELEAYLDGLVEEGYAYRTHLCPPEDASAFELRRRPPEGAASLRIVEIDGMDFTPCCGTHVSSSRDLRGIAITGAQRYKGGTRLSFVAGTRFLDRAFTLGRRFAALAATLAVSEEGVEGKVAGLAGDLEIAGALAVATLSRRARIDESLALAEAGEAKALVLRYRESSIEEIQASAKLIARDGRLVVASCPGTLKAIGFSSAPGISLGALAKSVIEGAGGRGGGGPGSFQAAFAEEAELERFMEGMVKALAAIGESPTEIALI